AIFDTVFKQQFPFATSLVACLPRKNAKIYTRSRYSFFEVCRKHLHHHAFHFPRYTAGVLRLTCDKKLWHQRRRQSRTQLQVICRIKPSVKSDWPSAS